MSDINVKMDISDVVSKTSQLLNLTKAQENALKSLVATTLNLTEQGKLANIYTEKQISANYKLLTTITGVGTENERTSRTIKATTLAIQRQREEIQRLLTAGARERVNKIVAGTGLKFSADELARIEKIKTAISKLDPEVATAKRIGELFKDIKAGNIPEATGALAKLRDELIKLNALQEKVRANSVRDASGGVVDRQAELQRRAIGRSSAFQAGFTGKFVDPIAATFGIDRGQLNIAQVAQIQKIGSSIARVMRNSVNEDLRKVVDTKQLQTLLPELLQGKKVDFINRPELQAAADQLNKLIVLFERLRRAQDQAANTAGIKATNQAAKSAAASVNAQRAAEFRKNFEKDFITELERQFRIKRSDLTTRQEGVLRNAAAAIARQIQSTGLDKASISSLFDQLRAGGAITPPTGDLAKTASELTKVIGLFERLRQERERQSRVNQNALDQRLISDTEAKRAERKIQIIQERLRRAFQNVRAQLANIDPQLDVNGNKFNGLIRKIAELGAKSGLSSRQVAELNQRLQSNSLTAADSKYVRLIEHLTKLNAQIAKAKQNANAFTGQPIFPGGLPPTTGGGGRGAAGGSLPPRPDDIANAAKYSTIYEKIRNSLDYFILYRGFNVISTQLADAFTNARKFQIQISLIRTISQDAQLTFREWERGLTQISTKSGLDFLDVASGVYDAVSNQVVKGRQAFDFAAKAGDLARTTNSTFTDSVNILSSAINSYGIDVNDADIVSAKFFKTIDLGRIQAKELANTFGRVSFVGRDLGVDFEELLAILSTLTRNGITTDDAITLLTNGMNKLTNPTEKMKAVLNEFGFSSGRAAVQTLGFTQTMLKLISAVESGKIEITDLFNEIRGEKYASAFKTFKGEIIRDLDEIKNKSLDTYKAAINIRSESDADVVNKQINQLKNTLATGFGNEFTNLVKNFIDISGGVDALASNLNRLTQIVIIGGTAFATYKTVILATQLATASYTAVTTTLTAVTGAYTSIVRGGTAAQAASTAITRLDTAAKAANSGATAVNSAQMRLNAAAYYAHPIGLFLASAGALYALWKTSNYEIGTYNEKLAGLGDVYDTLIQKQKEVVTTNVFAAFQKTFDEADSQFKGLGNIIASGLSGANRELIRARDTSKETSDSLRTGFEQYTNSMKNRISEIAREYGRLDDRIKGSNKSILSLRELARSQLFDTRLKYSGGFEFDRFGQRERLMLQEAARIKEEIQKLFASGTDEDVQRARQLGAEYLRVKKDLFDLRQERDQLSLEEDIKKNPQSYRTNPDGQVVRLVDERPLEQEQNQFLGFFETLETAYRARVTKEAASNEKKLIEAKDRLKKAEEAIRQLDKIKIFDEGGNVLPEFKDETSGRVNIDRVRRKFEEAKKRVNETIDPETLKKLGPEVEKLIQDRIDAAEAEITASTRVETFRQKQTEVLESTKALEKGFQNSRKHIQDYAQDINLITENLNKLAEGLKVYTGQDLENALAQKLNPKASTSFARGLNVLLDRSSQQLLGRSTQPAIVEAQKRITPLRSEIEAVQRDITELPKKTITQDGIQIIDPVQVQSTLDRLTAVRVKVQEIIREVAGSDQVVNKSVSNALSLPQITQVEDQLRNQLRTKSGLYNQSVLDLQTLDLETKKLTESTATTIKNFESFGPAISAGVGTAAAEFTKFNVALNGTNSQIDAIIAKMQTLSKSGLTTPATAAQPKNFGGMMYYPLGGKIPYYADGGPVGSDMQQVYAQSGEYIWNRTATRRFHSQINAMNSQGRTPISFSTSEGDTINVGGVTINESKNPQMTGTEVLRQIRRAQRRGIT